MTKKLINTIILLSLLVKGIETSAQFYNGHKMNFGKNRVQYNSFYWSFIRYERFDTYFNEYGKTIAEYTAEYAEKELARIENLFDYNLDKRIIFVVYNKLTDFRQSNIGLITGNTDNNIGGVTQIDRNKVFIYFEGDYNKLEQQISGAIVQVLIGEMIYGIDLKQNVASSTLLNLPEWFVKGLVAYISKDWDIETENKVRDGILSGRYKKFSRLVGEDATYAGHSFWKYIAEVYGETVIPSIIYVTKIQKNANVGFLYILGSPLKSLSRDWRQFYIDSFSDFEEQTTAISEQGKIQKRPHRKRVYQQIKVNPNGKYIAYVTNQMGRYKIWLHNLETGKKKVILKKEHKLQQIIDYSYPVMAWHPGGRTLIFITEEKGGLLLYFYTFGEKKLQKRNLLYFEKVLDFSFSHDGTMMVMSAIKEGKTDIYVHNLASGTNLQITNDIATDINPKFIRNSEQIIFSSNRRSDSLSVAQQDKKIAPSNDLFIYNYTSKDDLLMRLSDENYVNKIQPMEAGQSKFLLLSDRNGIMNRYYSEFDSTVSFVDTAVHYRYFAETRPITNYARNIVEQDYNSKSGILSEIIFNKGRYHMYQRPLDIEEKVKEGMPKTKFRNSLTKKLQRKDSIQNIEIIEIPVQEVMNDQLVYNEDTITFDRNEIDINNYIFEIERLNLYNSKLEEKSINLRIVEDEEQEEKKVRIYQESFYQNYLVSQVDFSFLNESYQAFTGGAVYFTPGLNLLLKLGTHDLFEDYKITGGYRLPIDGQSNEYLISIENLKKKIDKNFIFHRQVFKHLGGDEYSEYIKTITNEASGILRYPFSQVNALAASIGVRADRHVFLYDIDLSKMPTILIKPDVKKYWSTLKLEYIFDNTRSLGLNLHGGSRYKIFSEYYQQLNGKFDNLFVAGTDIRNYIVLHRNLIWANRFAASTSIGSSRLIYYLGGVDNWFNFNQARTPTFIPLSEIRIDETENYAFQAIATNMRGFSQNIRNGNSFALFNSEIRFPVISYLVNHPLSNAFLQNFQVVGFFDIGTAWSGLHPWSKKNAYDNDIIQQGPIIIEIDADREPVVAGYGFGLRSQLLGYFVRVDWAWGIENMQVLPRVFYLSLSLDY